MTQTLPLDLVFSAFFFFLKHQLVNPNVLLEIQSLLADWSTWRQVSGVLWTPLKEAKCLIQPRAEGCLREGDKALQPGTGFTLQEESRSYRNFPCSPKIPIFPVGLERFPQDLCKSHSGLGKSHRDPPEALTRKGQVSTLVLRICGYGTWKYCRMKILLLSLNSTNEWK